MFLTSRHGAKTTSRCLALLTTVAISMGLDACGGVAGPPQQPPTKAREQTPAPPNRVRVVDSLAEAQTPTTSPSKRTVDSDGSIAKALPDGGKRIAKPGVCGFTTVNRDGTRSIVTCAQVPLATPPITDQVSAKWLQAHRDSLLDVIRQLTDETSVKNYLSASENGGPDVYTQIRLRTDLIRLLTEQ